ncbi:putative protein involved in cation transport [Thalassovita gelatinovora]|uniref:glutathione-specific gamma-glutamylcyclotransferase n=1 Tax=Thalassovita gelatinovora TaxID=53501 RepID=A0A0P1F8Z9_THAGE|nr:gamma-glutamylcyclotransferase [Thalassovita gelatinovora]QIZ81350.1 gamma-glutamylcyclotransferase [Thalassovita gelatinovora]CUH64461.1 putative protein involved in cation transport [Thalassovita gelatinovora]SEP98262.1 cation transport protein ChaC [Thalassovita gelatinovora]
MTMWVFGYGSLLWNPGFNPVESVLARLPGYHRSFCMWSIHHRGSEEKPGLVLALDAVEALQCNGLALAVHPDEESRVLEDLRERELVSSAYLERRLQVDLNDGRRVEAVTYVVDPVHGQYCGGMALEQQAHVIAHAHGGRGPNAEYLYNTAAHLHQLGIRDPDLDWLSDRVREIRA